MIPPEVIFSDQLGKFIYIVDKDSKAKRVDIKHRLFFKILYQR